MEIFTLVMLSNFTVLLVDNDIKKNTCTKYFQKTMFLYKIMNICHSVAAVHS